MRKNLMAAFIIIVLFALSTVQAEGLLPSLTETVGIAMPSLGEALGRYPDEETENEDGSITELYMNVSETDFNDFSVYLQQQEAELADYKVEKGILTAEIRAKGAAFRLSYNSKSGEAEVTYPAGLFDERTKNAKAHFDAAQKLLDEGKADEAYAEISAIPQFASYRPVDGLMKNDDNFAAAAEAATAVAAVREAKLAPYREVGGVVTFGTYPQTSSGNDQTPVEWIVLDYDEANHKALLLSKYGLDTVQYNTDVMPHNTWEQCNLRAWLNGEFLNKAFSSEEQNAILTAEVDNSAGQSYDGLDGGNNTEDKIFLLSYAEANRYLGVKPWKPGLNDDLTKPRVAPTAYAIAQGATTDQDQTADGVPAGEWWLRSPGTTSIYGMCVSTSGHIARFFYDRDDFVVRPVFWINLESDIF